MERADSSIRCAMAITFSIVVRMDRLTFCDRQAFLAADLSNCTIEEPPRPGMIFAPDIWNRIVASAHKYAEPGIAFIDEVNRHNHMMKSMGPIYSCNPCGEQFLHFSNSCNSVRSISRSFTIRKNGSIGIGCVK